MVKLYVEGGGDTNALRTACREGFTTFLTQAGLRKRPRVVACGSRQNAFESYCTAIANGEDAVLLIDSEAAVDVVCEQGPPASWRPWQHLKQRPGDGWDKPMAAADTDCHLMVQCMESWFLADRQTLQSFFGHGFNANQLPAAASAMETIPKAQVYQALANATTCCKTKAPYGKGEHSFKLLAKINPVVVKNASPWARRFVDELLKKMDSA